FPPASPRWGRLRWLDLEGNDLTGPIPPPWGSIANSRWREGLGPRPRPGRLAGRGKEGGRRGDSDEAGAGAR
ncbi:MAG: hypothetical protein OXG35_27750, partial [Acidobacteria bacterium]|nr:hypothetical protein [Acidobacteriota bacterium]